MPPVIALLIALTLPLAVACNDSLEVLA